jgi:hypothetical protein
MEAGGGGGSCAGVVAVAAVSAAVTLATVRLFHGLESDFRRKIQLQRRTCSPRNLNLQLALCMILHGCIWSFNSGSNKPGGVREATAKKKVRFADDVMEPSSSNKEYRRKRQRFPLLAGQA